MGSYDKPLNYSELLAWCELAGFKFDIWECELMISLASTYLHSLSEYKESAAPPFMTEESKIIRAKTIAAIRRETLRQAGK